MSPPKLHQAMEQLFVERNRRKTYSSWYLKTSTALYFTYSIYGQATRCFESLLGTFHGRSIGKYKKLIKSKVNAGANAGNILERLTTRNHINSQSWSVHNELDLLTPCSYAEKSFKNNPSGEANDPQLWEPFQNCLVISLPVGVDSRLFSKALLKYYRRTEPNGASIVGIASLDSLYIAGRAWAYNNVYTSTLYKDHISEHRRGNNYIMFTASYV
jgi:hypothetical protein